MSAPARIRVLIVDDSVTIRQLLVEGLGAESDLEVVGTLANGAIALTQLARLAPDVIVLDLHMPVLDGIGFLERLRPQHPRLPVLVFSTITTHGAPATLQAMWAGASDYLAKPHAGDHAAARAFVHAELAPRLRLLHRGTETSVRDRAPQSPVAARAGVPLRHAAPIVSVVAIGASTGGPRALADVLSALPADLEAPVLVVQHIPAAFTRHLADGLASQCELDVREAKAGAQLEPGTVWIAAGDHHLIVKRARGQLVLALEQTPPEHACRPAVDPLLCSLADVFGPAALAVILTGMGQDGLAGCLRIRSVDGQVIAQDESTSVVWGMPGSVVRAGLADAVLPLEAIAAEILTRVRRGRVRRVA